MIETAKPDIDVSVVRPTQKPTNLDEPMAISYAEVRLNRDNDTQPQGERHEKGNSGPPEQVPTSLSFQTDGLLMIKPISCSPVEEEKKTIVNDEQSAAKRSPETKREVASVGTANGIHYGSTVDYAPPKNVNSEPCGDVEVTVETKTVETKERWKIQPLDLSKEAPMEAAVKESTEKWTVSSTTVTYKAEVAETPTSARSDSPASPLSVSTRWPPNQLQPPAQAESVSPRPQIVYNDPKKGMYPSMKVRSFEDEYYTTRQGVVSDYVKAVKYGMVSEFTSSKEEREKNKEKLEATVAKRINNSGGWRPVQASSRPPQPNVTTTKMADRKPSITREVSHPPTGSSSTTTAPSDDVNIRLQREYEKLQAMFADWQFRLKQHESIIDSGRKLSPEQMLAFQRLQDEMMEQHRYVQGLCSEVQKLEKETSPTSSTAGPIAMRLENLKGSARAASMKSGFNQADRRPSEPPPVLKKTIVDKPEPEREQSAKKTVMTPAESTSKCRAFLGLLQGIHG